MEGGFISEQEVAERVGVSRTPVREALLQLAAEDLVQLVPNRGAYIAPLTGRDLLSATCAMPSPSRPSARGRRRTGTSSPSATTSTASSSTPAGNAMLSLIAGDLEATLAAIDHHHQATLNLQLITT